MTSLRSLPIIDMAKVQSDRLELSKTVVDALETVGFLFIDNIRGIDNDKLFKCCQWFFGLPVEEKRRITKQFWEPNNKNVYRGYFPIIDRAPSRKQGFEFGRDVPEDSRDPNNWFYENSTWPQEDGSFPFRQFLIETYNILHETSLEILRLTAIGIGIEEKSFDEMFSNKPMTSMRLIHYPPWDGNPPSNAKIEDGKVVTTPDHTDSNFLTLLYTFHFKGLEVLTGDGEWVQIQPRPDSLVMNIGDVFSRMMGGRFKATRHRVIDIGVDRFSVPFFFEPGYDADISLNFLSKVTGKGKKYAEERYGPWVLHRMKYEKKFVEFIGLPDIESRGTVLINAVSCT